MQAAPGAGPSAQALTAPAPRSHRLGLRTKNNNADGGGMRATTISTTVAALFLGALAAEASAQDYCVTCTGPDAKYHCIIGGGGSPAARSSRGQILCITQLAQSGGHASCSVSRTSSEPCEGQVKTVMFPTDEPGTPPMAETLPPASPPPATAPSSAQPPALTEGAPPPTEAPQQQPSTVGQIAKDSANGLKQAGEAVTSTVDKTGKAIGHAASKTWKCLSSFFGDC